MADPLAWNRKAQLTGIRLRVFTNSLSDFFDNQVDDRWRADAWDIIRQTTSLDWLVLTKRPQNIGRMLPPDWGTGWDHVWLGATVEDMIEAHRRIPHLLAVPAKTRFLSGEPMLEPLNLTPWLATRDLHWVILGGESGSKRRPTFPDWMRDTRDQCVWLGVPVFVKQMCGGETVPIPADLQVWEYPQ
jgi:protein gp37